MTQVNQHLRTALVEAESVITSTLANAPEDDAKCERSLYDAVCSVYNIVDRTAFIYKNVYHKTQFEIKDMIITTPQCVCPLCGGSISFATFSYLFHCSKCGQNYAPDKAQYLKGGKELLDAAERSKDASKRII